MVGDRTNHALVTGAGRRIGHALAIHLAQHGWAVTLHARDSIDTADATARTIRNSGGRAQAIQADLTNQDSISVLLNESRSGLGMVRLLVNNAATFIPDRLHTATRDTVETNLQVNLIAPMFLAQGFAAQFDRHDGGNIVNVLDQRVDNPTPHYMSYSASKYALAILTRTWSLELAPRIRVNAVNPGMALPDVDGDESEMTEWTKNFPLRRGTSPAEICTAVDFLLSTPSVTGESINLDSGQRLGWLHPDSGYPIGEEPE